MLHEPRNHCFNCDEDVRMSQARGARCFGCHVIAFIYIVAKIVFELTQHADTCVNINSEQRCITSDILPNAFTRPHRKKKMKRIRNVTIESR